MSYVPGHEYDVFVSYARRNNQDGFLDGQYGWVTRFQKNLERILNERCPGVRVFFDDGSIAGNDDLDDKVVTAVQQSATLVVVLSPVYLSRPYCTKERELYCSRIGDEKLALPRIFLVHYDDVPFDERPEILRKPKGYNFFHQDATVKSLRRPLEDDSDPLKEEYKNRIYELCGDIQNKLKELKQTLPQTTVPKKVIGPDSAGSLSAPVIFLAEATPDLRGHKDRLSVESALRQAGFRVLPETTYDRRNLPAYQQSLEEDLNQSLLFVQILGESGSIASPDLPHGFEGLQFSVARAAGKPCLRWRPSDLPLDSIREFMAVYHQYLTDADANVSDGLQPDERVQAGFLNDFKLTVEETVRKLLARQAKPGGKKLDESHSVLLSPQTVDSTLAKEFDQRTQQAVLSDVADEAYPLTDVYENEAGLVVVYGQSTYDWVKERVKQCREIALNNASNPPVCAIYVGPPDPKPPLPKRPANFHVIHHDDPAALAAYLAEVTAKGVSP